MTVRPGDDELDVVFERTIDAPQALVFRAWTDPAMLVRWWGPKDFTNAACRVDLRPGGVFSLVMITPTGLELPVAGIYREIEPPARLVYLNTADAVPADERALLRNYAAIADGRPVPPMLITVTFTELGARQTRLTMTTRFESLADRDAVVARGSAMGWGQSLQRLADLVAP
jgi:uncharacterized protein YndB with AHSA1/START domain